MVFDMQITVNGLKINNTVSSIKNRIYTINSLICKLDGMIDSIPTYWSSDDAKKYISFMKENCIKKLQNMSEILNEDVEYLEKLPNVYDILDESFSNENISV